MWWVFEGHLYPWLESSLAFKWPVIDRHAQKLLATYNPKWSVTDLPEGETDWVGSAFREVTERQPSYINKASRAGLGEQEQKALKGWLAWVEREWTAYVASLGPPLGVVPELPWSMHLSPRPPDLGQLRRWAHVARRSRWPLMRHVVAESIRCILEPQELDQIPLPSDPPSLFELLCMVRILKVMGNESSLIRWLDADIDNYVDLPGLRYFYQKSFPREVMLGTHEFLPEVREAIVRHDAGVPGRADGLLQFETPRLGFSAVLVEAKSGNQAFDATIYQLKSYQAALAKTSSSRILVWGIVEKEPDSYQNTPMSKRLKALRQAFESTNQGDFWMFSTANEIKSILDALGFSKNVESVSPSEGAMERTAAGGW